MASAILIRRASSFVTSLLSGQLPAEMYFHNLMHTQDVVNAAEEIGRNSGVDKKEMDIVKLAAWFHDTGYCYAYTGHEDNSIAIAATFLKQQNCDEDIINGVMDCIVSTKMPQLPQNLVEQVMCDADMFHLAKDDYLNYALRLRMEWEAKLPKKHTDEEWRELNLNWMIRHKYFTKYGQTVLQEKKLANIDRLLIL
jgi:uncharacterized protein